MYICMYVCNVCMYVCMHACMHACMHVRTYVCICVYTYIYIYVYLSLSIHIIYIIYIYIHILGQSWGSGAPFFWGYDISIWATFAFWISLLAQLAAYIIFILKEKTWSVSGGWGGEGWKGGEGVRACFKQ